MAKNDYNADAQTALELIEEFGVEVKWNQFEAKDDVEEPWKDESVAKKVYKPSVCFVPTNDAQWRKLLMALKGTEVPVGRLAGLMAGNVKFEPSKKDTVTRGKDTLLIESIDTLMPADMPVLYTIEFKA